MFPYLYLVVAGSLFHAFMNQLSYLHLWSLTGILALQFLISLRFFFFNLNKKVGFHPCMSASLGRFSFMSSRDSWYKPFIIRNFFKLLSHLIYIYEILLVFLQSNSIFLHFGTRKNIFFKCYISIPVFVYVFMRQLLKAIYNTQFFEVAFSSYLYLWSLSCIFAIKFDISAYWDSWEYVFNFDISILVCMGSLYWNMFFINKNKNICFLPCKFEWKGCFFFLSSWDISNWKYAIFIGCFLV